MMPTKSEWSIALTRSLRGMTHAEATVLMDEYELDEATRKLLAPHVGTAILPSEKVLANYGRDPADFQADLIAGYIDENGNEILPQAETKPWLHDPDRPLWLSSAWLAGAVSSVLALIHGVSSQAIQQSVKRAMPDTTARHTHRLGYRLSSGRVREMRIRFYDNAIKLRGLSP